MGSQAIDIAAAAYRAFNLTEPTSFSTTQEFPLDIAINVLNEVIGEMNRLGSLWFMETNTALTYTNGVCTYSFSTLAIDPRRIMYLRKEATNYWGEMIQLTYRDFLRLCRMASIQTTQPQYWTKFGDTLTLDAYPDQDYTITVYHYKDMPKVSATTDTFLLPERQEDVLIENCVAWLGYKIGKWDYAYAKQQIELKTAPMVVELKADTGLPNQMSRMF